MSLEYNGMSQIMSRTNWERKFKRANVPGSESSRANSLRGTKVPGSERARERKFQGAKIPASELARERKGCESVENFTENNENQHLIFREFS